MSEKSETAKLTEAITRLDQKIARQQKMSYNFFRGVLYGFGFFIGGTVIVAMLISLLSFLAPSTILGDLPEKVLKYLSL